MKRSSDKDIAFLLFTFAILALITISSYIITFHHHSISESPSDWGVFGDYIGGVLNPLISFVTLCFLIKTYFSQRAELRNNEEQNVKQLRIQVLQSKISASYELLAVYRHELDRLIENKKAEGIGTAYYFISIEGERYLETQVYLDKVIRKLRGELENIRMYKSEIDQII